MLDDLDLLVGRQRGAHAGAERGLEPGQLDRRGQRQLLAGDGEALVGELGRERAGGRRGLAAGEALELAVDADQPVDLLERAAAVARQHRELQPRLGEPAGAQPGESGRALARLV